MWRLTRPSAAAVVALALLAQPVGAEPWDGDLTKEADFTIQGVTPGGWAGGSVAGAGDVNGDGLEDMIVGTPDGDDLRSDRAYVVFGRPFPRVVRLADIGEPDNLDGFLIYNGDGGYAYRLGRSVAAVGDMNHDGLDDVIVGSPETTFHGIPDDQTGAAHVVFGKASYDTVNVRQLGEGGFEIRGPWSEGAAGWSVAGVGDMNQDGDADVAVSAHAGSGDPAREYSGAAYVVFGKPTPEPVELAALGGEGFQILGSYAFEQAGNAVAGAGDVNGDRVPDLIVGAAVHDRENWDEGAAYVVFGKSTPEQVDLASLGDQGFLIEGYYRSGKAGFGVAGVGDMNGDGLDDVAVGAPRAGYPDTVTGYVYVVFGKSTPDRVDLGDLGDQGFSIRGAGPEENAGWSVAGAGDVNGDGVPDLVIGSPVASWTQPGKAYVVFGKSSSETIDLEKPLGKRGFRFEGKSVSDLTGYAVAGPGDLDQDGHGEVMVGAPQLLVDGSAMGGAFVLYGLKQPTLHYEPVVGTVGVPLKVAAPAGIRTGDASFSVSPELQQGLALDRQTGAVSGTPTWTQPESVHTVTVTDWVGTGEAPLAIQIDELKPRENGSGVRRCASFRKLHTKWKGSRPRKVRLELVGSAGTERRQRCKPFIVRLRIVRDRHVASIRKVVFRIDGRTHLIDRRFPYRAPVAPAQLGFGRHVIEARVIMHHGKVLKHVLRFVVS